MVRYAASRARAPGISDRDNSADDFAPWVTRNSGDVHPRQRINVPGAELVSAASRRAVAGGRNDLRLDLVLSRAHAGMGALACERFFKVGAVGLEAAFGRRSLETRAPAEDRALSGTFLIL